VQFARVVWLAGEFSLAVSDITCRACTTIPGSLSDGLVFLPLFGYKLRVW